MTNNLQNPFPGLRSFDYAEQHLFFGREKHVHDLLEKLEQHHQVFKNIGNIVSYDSN